MGVTRDGHRRSCGAGLAHAGRMEVMGDYSTPAGDLPKALHADGRVYWFVLRLDDVFRVKALGPNSLPAGVSREVPVDEFPDRFTPEPLHYTQHTLPAVRRFIKSVAGLGERVELFVALGFRPQPGEDARAWARRVLEELEFSVEAVRFRQSRELSARAVALRKAGRAGEALPLAAKAVEIKGDDEHLLFNLARVHHELGDARQALSTLQRALAINPGFKDALVFVRFLSKAPPPGSGRA